MQKPRPGAYALHLMLGLSALFLALHDPRSALAQDAQPGLEEADELAGEDAQSGGELRETPTQGIEEIVITGEVLESTTQAEPQAITTFSQEELDTLGIADVDTLALNTPALHVGQVGQQAVITLRGVGLENLTSVGEAGVGFQVDGIHLGRPSAANSVFFDLERVDVLRGPQGTEGGRNLTAGKIALNSKRPEEDFEMFGDLTFGNFDSVQTRAVVNVPIWEDKLLTRTSVLYESRTGYQKAALLPFTLIDPLSTGPDNVRTVRDSRTDDADDVAVRGQLRSLWADQTLELRAIATYAQQKGNGPALQLLGAPPDGSNSRSTGRIVQLDLQQPGFADNFAVDQLVPRDANGNPIPTPEFPVTGTPLPSNCPDPVDPLFQSPEINIPGQGPTQFPALDPCIPSDPRVSYFDTPHMQDNFQIGITGQLSYDIPLFEDTEFSDLRFGFVGGWWNILTDSTADFDGFNLPDSRLDLRRDSRQHSVEFFLERPDVGRFDFKTGFFWFREDIDTDVCFDSLADGTAGDTALDNTVRTTSIAGYGTVGFRPLDSLRVFAGLRYTSERKKAIQLSESFRPRNNPNQITSTDGQTRAAQDGCGLYFRNLLQRPQELVIETVTNPDDIQETFSAFTPAAGFDWQINDSSTLGFSVTRGFKAGGFPLGNPGAPGFENLLGTPYPAEMVWEYEVSSKNDFFDGRLRVNATAFWTEYDPFQICQFNGPNFFCRGDGSATIRGVELEWNATPIEGLAINGFFNYLDSRINNFLIEDPTVRGCEFIVNADTRMNCEMGLVAPRPPPTPVKVDVSGNSLPKAPNWAGSLGVQYTIDLGRFGFLTPRAQTQFQGQTFFRVFNLEEFSQAPFAKLDLKLFWRSQDDRFTAEFFVNNVTDEDVINSVFVGPQQTGGQVLAQYQPPRLVGFKIGVNYMSDLFDRFF